MHYHRPSEEDLLNAALRLADPAQRVAYLDQACGDDSELRRRVEALIEAHFNADQFLEKPHRDVPARTVAIGPGVVPVTEKPGDRIGRYKLLQQIGEGGCGVVYMAEQEEPVASSNRKSKIQNENCWGECLSRRRSCMRIAGW